MENRLSGIEHELTGVKHDVSGLEHQMSNLRLEMHRGFRKNDDEIQTIIAILEGRGLLPKAQ